jgi:hypothetical protein
LSFKNNILIAIIGMSLCFGLNLTLHDFDNPEASHILDTHVMGDILIVVGMVGGIEIYDISNPSVLNHIAHFTLPNNETGGGSKPNCVSTYNNYAYFTAKNGVGIVNLENPSNPQYIGYIQNTNNMILENLDIEGNILAVCAHTDGVLFFDLTNPENPNLIHTEIANNAWAVEMISGVLEQSFPIICHIGDENTIKRIIITENYEIISTYEFETPGMVKDLLVSFITFMEFDQFFERPTLYVALGTEGVYAYDLSLYDNQEITDPPPFKTSYNTSGLANRLDHFFSIQFLSPVVVVSDWDDVEILKFSPNNEVIRVGHKNTTRRTMAIATKGGYPDSSPFIYSAEWATVQVFEYGEIDGPDIDLSAYEINYPFVENGDSNTISIDITNNGNALLEITDVFTTNNEFTVSEFSNLLPGESQSIAVTYTAENINASGGLRIWSNDEDEPDLTCEVNGNIEGANIGESAPDFELEIVANGSGIYRLSEHLGEIIVLAFFSPG